MSREELDRLVANRVLERIAADPETARAELEQARLHVESAAEIADRDPVGAFAIGRYASSAGVPPDLVAEPVAVQPAAADQVTTL